MVQTSRPEVTRILVSVVDTFTVCSDMLRTSASNVPGVTEKRPGLTICAGQTMEQNASPLQAMRRTVPRSAMMVTTLKSSDPIAFSL